MSFARYKTSRISILLYYRRMKEAADSNPSPAEPGWIGKARPFPKGGANGRAIARAINKMIKRALFLNDRNIHSGFASSALLDRE